MHIPMQVFHAPPAFRKGAGMKNIGICASTVASNGTCLPKPALVNLHYQCKHQPNTERRLRRLAANQAANGSTKMSSACLLARRVRLVAQSN